MSYVYDDNGELEYPFSKEYIRVRNPEISFTNIISDEIAAEFHVYPVTEEPQPTFDEMTQTIDYKIEKRNSEYFKVWIISELSDQEKQEKINFKISEVLGQRQALLNIYVDRVNHFWYQSMTDEQKNILSTYRQNLLDITKQPGYPLEVIWPDPPIL